MFSNHTYGGAAYGGAGRGPDIAITPGSLSLAASAFAPTVKAGFRWSAAAGGVAVSAVSPTIKAGVRLKPVAWSASMSAPSPVVFIPLSAERARGGTRLKPVWLAEVALKNSGPTLYLSDGNVSVSGQRYENYIDGVSGMGDEFRPDTSGMSNGPALKFKNDRFRSYGRLSEVGDDHPFEGAALTLREAYLDDEGRPSMPATLFKGALDEPRDMDLLSFSCGASTAESSIDRAFKQAVIDTAAWPNAYEDLGEAEPIIYGSNILAPALRVDWGARTTLQAEINASAASLTLSDASRFPSSGALWLDDEKISYSGKSGNALTGLSRGAGGTTATSHRAGAEAAEAKPQYDSLLAGHELHAVGDIFAEIKGTLWRVTSGVSAALSGGKHLLRATDYIKVKALKDDVSVADNISVSIGGSTKKVYPNSITGSRVADGGNAYDGNEGTFAMVNSSYQPGYGDIKLYFPSTDYGAISTQYVRAKILGNVGVSGGWTPSSVAISIAGWCRFQKSGGGWGDYISFGNAVSGEMITVYEVEKEVEYSAQAAKSGSAYRSGEVVATHSVERFHAVVSGFKDDASGTYTGAAGALVERPDHAMKHFLVEALGVPLDEMDAASFDAAGALYASAISGGYKFAFRIGEKIRPSEFLRRMALECRSALRYSKGKWLLTYITATAPDAVRTIKGGDLSGERSKFKFGRTPVDALSNDLSARYRRNYSRMRGDSPWDATASASDSASVSKYGLYPKSLDFELIRDASTASHVLSHMLLEKKEPRLTVEFSVFYEHFDLEPGDTVEIENPLYGGRKFLIEGLRRTDKFRAALRGREWWG